jgi:tRNA(Ile2) C34 agmatinyltransferase TiaS
MILAIEALEKELSKLKNAVLDGTYGTRSIVGDAVINMDAVLRVLKENLASQQPNTVDGDKARPQCPACYADMQVMWECKKCGHTSRR